MAVQSLTLEKIRKKARRQLEGSSIPQYDDDYLDGVINNVQLDINSLTEVLQKKGTISVESGTKNYSLPADWFHSFYFQFIDSGGDTRRLEPMDLPEYLSIRRVTTSSLPESYTIDLAANEVIIYPTPTGAGHTIDHYYSPHLEELVNNADIPFNGDTRLYTLHTILLNMVIDTIRAKENETASGDILARYSAQIISFRNKLMSGRKGGAIVMKRYKRSVNLPRVDLPPNYPSLWR